MYEGLSGKSLGKAVVGAPKSALQKIGNLTAVLNAFQSDGVRVDISAQGIFSFSLDVIDFVGFLV
jgi:hypothetical protein